LKEIINKFWKTSRKKYILYEVVSKYLPNTFKVVENGSKFPSLKIGSFTTVLPCNRARAMHILIAITGSHDGTLNTGAPGDAVRSGLLRPPEI
jgi:hypothetical protein